VPRQHDKFEKVEQIKWPEGSISSVHNKQQTEGTTNASKHKQNEETWQSPGALRWDGTQGTVTERDVHESFKKEQEKKLMISRSFCTKTVMKTCKLLAPVVSLKRSFHGRNN
jgi:hypothetical protein